MKNKVRGLLIGFYGLALVLNDAMASGATNADDAPGPELVVAIGVGVLLLMGTAFRRRRGRN